MVNVVELVQREDGADLVEPRKAGAHTEGGSVGKEIHQATDVSVQLKGANL